MHGFRFTILRAIFATGLFIALWLGITLTIGGIKVVDLIGWALLYFIGLAWIQFLVEQEAGSIEARRIHAQNAGGGSAGLRTVASTGEIVPAHPGWNPFDPTAWYYRVWVSLAAFLMFALVGASYVMGSLGLFGSQAGAAMSPAFKAGAIAAGMLAMAALAAAVAQGRRLRQSLALLATYSILFVAVYVLVHMRWGTDKESEFELPPGGGSESVQASVKVKKVVRKKYVVNPFSQYHFNAVVPIDIVDVKLDVETANQYKVGTGGSGGGVGGGKGGGFGKGDGSGKLEFVRLEHSDIAWNKNMGIGRGHEPASPHQGTSGIP